jgi:hypothetical protein
VNDFLASVPKHLHHMVKLNESTGEYYVDEKEKKKINISSLKPIDESTIDFPPIVRFYKNNWTNVCMASSVPENSFSVLGKKKSVFPFLSDTSSFSSLFLPSKSTQQFLDSVKKKDTTENPSSSLTVSPSGLPGDSPWAPFYFPSSFNSLLSARNYVTATPIQQQAIPYALGNRKFIRILYNIHLSFHSFYFFFFSYE